VELAVNAKGAVCGFLRNQELNTEQPGTINTHSGQNPTTNGLENSVDFGVSCFVKAMI
jgi:hypothetical protein